MKKIIVLISILFILTACGESAEEKRAKYIDQQIAARDQQLQQQQYAPEPQQYVQQPTYEQPVQQPQIIQQPASPVIVNQPAAESGSSAMTNMLVGGLIGHSIANMGNNSQNNYRPEPRYYDDHFPSRPRVTNNITKNITINQPATVPKKNYMDMNKLSQSATYKPPVVSRPSAARLPSSIRRK